MTDTPKSGPGLDSETLAAFVDGRLPPAERARVEADLAADPQLFEWLAHSLQAQSHVNREVPESGVAASTVRALPIAGGFSRRRPVRIAVVGALAIAAALVLAVRFQPAWWATVWRSSDEPQMAALVDAVGNERYIDARLMGGFKYGPLQSVTRGQDYVSDRNLSVLAAAAALRKSAEADPSAQHLHGWGVAQVLLGDRDAAIETLERALAARESDPAILVDLSAAYLARARARGTTDGLQRAHDLATRAISLSPDLSEAYFNRAMASELLGLSTAAGDWRAAQSHEASAEWRAEAERHARASPSDVR